MRRLLDLIVFSHSVFALPFALASFVFAWRLGPLKNQREIWVLLALVVICAVAARTSAMAFNRLVDLKFDRANPRTIARELVTGKVSIREGWGLVFGSSALFFLGSGLLGTHCLVLAPFVLAVLLGYSLAKRFTPYSHLILGLALALAPGGAWWVLRPVVEFAPLLLMAGVLFWVGGFDIIYSCQDVDFDRAQGLHSLPAKLGIPKALRLSRFFHLTAFVLFAAVGWMLNFGWGYYLGLLPIAWSFRYQHSLVQPDDLSRVNRAFFTANGWVSIYFLLLALVTGYPS